MRGITNFGRRGTDRRNVIFMEMEQHPASRASHARDCTQRGDAPRSPMETCWEQATVYRRWMDPCRGWDRDLSIGGANRLRCRPGTSLHAHIRRTLCYKPQPDVFGMDLTLSWRCTYHTKRVDGRLVTSSGRTHPQGGPARRACAGGSVRGRLHQVPEAGSSLPLVDGVQDQRSDTRRAEDSPYAGSLEEGNCKYLILKENCPLADSPTHHFCHYCALAPVGL